MEVLVTFQEEPDAVELTKETQILVDADDYKGILLAAQNFGKDVGKASQGQDLDVILCSSAGKGPLGPGEDLGVTRTRAIVVGCIETSGLLKHLEERIDGVDFSALKGKWECFATTTIRSQLLEGFFGCETLFVIAGSDKRGAIYGLYTLSEQIGVSPYVRFTAHTSYCRTNTRA